MLVATRSSMDWYVTQKLRRIAAELNTVSQNVLQNTHLSIHARAHLLEGIHQLRTRIASGQINQQLLVAELSALHDFAEAQSSKPFPDIAFRIQKILALLAGSAKEPHADDLEIIPLVESAG